MTARLLIEIAVVGMFVLPGLLALWVGIANREWFFSNPQAQIWLRVFGRKGSRIATIVVGLLLLVEETLLGNCALRPDSRSSHPIISLER